ncbi:MAG: hypothetical protein IVW36_05850 [Dehalococcoidia bacterium]|nr:hypothetical protein [Dehalococcoidia bacterium]
MKLAAFALLGVVCVAAVTIIVLTFSSGTSRTAGVEAIATRAPAPTPAPTPLPRTWQAGLRLPSAGAPELISCRDRNGDGRLDGRDDAQLAGLDIALVPGEACRDPQQHADFYAGTPSDAAGFSCSAKRPPLLIVAVASAGSDLLAPKEGESIGELDMVNAIQAQVRAAGTSSLPILAASAVFGARPPQTSMEQWLTQQIGLRLIAMPCLRTAIIGHSHGGVTVTSVTAALDARFGRRMFGVLLDRTTVLYDRQAKEMPRQTPLLNIYQANEGWHGEAIDQANVTNVDASMAMAPVAPSDGGGGSALVSHKTLDDAPAVQRRVVDAVVAWATR